MMRFALKKTINLIVKNVKFELTKSQAFSKTVVSHFFRCVKNDHRSALTTFQVLVFADVDLISKPSVQP